MINIEISIYNKKGEKQKGGLVLDRKTLLCSIPAVLLLFTSAYGANPEPEKGLQMIGMLDFRKAAAFYERKMNKAKAGTMEWRRNAFLYAVSLMRRLPDRAEDKELAAEVLDDLINAGVQKPFSDGALLFRGKLAEQIDFHGDTPDFEGAAEYYGKLINERPKSKYRDYAVLCRAQVAVYTMDEKRIKAAIKQLMAWLEKYPKNRYAAVEWFLIADAARYPLKDYKLSLHALLQIEKNGVPACLLVDYFYWQVGNTAFEAKEMKTAALFYNKILKLDRSKFSTIAGDMLKKIKQEGK